MPGRCRRAASTRARPPGGRPARALRGDQRRAVLGALPRRGPGWYSYDLPTFASGKPWKGRYRGQTQKWFAFGFEGDEREIDILRPGGGAHKAEFDGWRWEPLANLADLVIPFKRPVYEQVIAAFAHLARPA